MLCNKRWTGAKSLARQCATFAQLEFAALTIPGTGMRVYTNEKTVIAGPWKLENPPRSPPELDSICTKPAVVQGRRGKR